MNTRTLKTLIVAPLFTLLLITGSITMAASIEGVVEGYHGCMVVKNICNVERNDPRVATEKNFVVVNKNGTYYFISNVDSSILSENLHNKAKVTGIVDNKYNTVKANKIEFFTNGGWHEAWSMNLDKREIDSFNL